jgi:hypothetical protein
MQTDEDIVQLALHASVPSDVLGVKRFGCAAVVAMRIKDNGVAFGWRFETEDGRLAKKYLNERDLLTFFPEHVSTEATAKIKEEIKEEIKQEKAQKRRANSVERMKSEFYFGMFTVRGNKAVHKIVEGTPLGKDAEETYDRIRNQLENIADFGMDEWHDTDVREHIWDRVLKRHLAVKN